MTTVREATFELFREHGLTTIFGNPGSTELPMLGPLPEDFRYVLGLHEMVAVGMADGYAQATGSVAHVNLHTAPGLGNGLGALFNARANKSPLLVTAGQQARSLMTMQANLTSYDAVNVPRPFVKWSYEPPRAEDVPASLGRAIHHASLPPAGPAFVSIPMDDWRAEVQPADFERQIRRHVAGRSQPATADTANLAQRLRDARNPALVAGPDIDASGGWDLAVELAERQHLPVWASPATGGGRIGFPENHPAFQGILPPAIGPLSNAIAQYDLVLVMGSSVFPYYPDIPGDLLPEGTRLVLVTSDPDEASRAPAGDAIVADVALVLQALLEMLREPSTRSRPARRPQPGSPSETVPLAPGAAYATLAGLLPGNAITVLESPSSTTALRNRLRISRPGSYYFGAGGGLGFALPASLGVQMAQPDRQVLCVLGEGSAQYAITAFWTAANYGIPVKFLVLRNNDYSILKWFSTIERVDAAPGLDLPLLDVAATAESYGVPSTAVSGRDELEEELRAAFCNSGPRLVQVDVQPGMAFD